MQELALKHQQGIANKQLFLQTLLACCGCDWHGLTPRRTRSSSCCTTWATWPRPSWLKRRAPSTTVCRCLIVALAHVLAGWGKNAKRQHVVSELISTEREYLKDLKLCVDGYLAGPNTLKGSVINTDVVCHRM